MSKLCSLGSPRLVSKSESGERHASQQSGVVVSGWSRGAPLSVKLDPLDVVSDLGMYCWFRVGLLTFREHVKLG